MLSRSFVSEQAELLKLRTMKFALDVSAILRRLPSDEPGPTVTRQMAKAATSTAANYRAACRARSHAAFTSKMGIVAEECDESCFWLEFIAGSDLARGAELHRLRAEARALVAIFSRALGTTRLNHRSKT